MYLVSRMLADCTGTRQEVYEASNGNILKRYTKGQDKDAEKQCNYSGSDKRQIRQRKYLFTFPVSEVKNVTGIKPKSENQEYTIHDTKRYT